LVFTYHLLRQFSPYLVAKIKKNIYLCKLIERKAFIETPICLFSHSSNAGVVLRDEVRP
jgi:hypothetical protein